MQFLGHITPVEIGWVGSVFAAGVALGVGVTLTLLKVRATARQDSHSESPIVERAGFSPESVSNRD